MQVVFETPGSSSTLLGSFRTGGMWGGHPCEVNSPWIAKVRILVICSAHLSSFASASRYWLLNMWNVNYTSWEVGMVSPISNVCILNNFFLTSGKCWEVKWDLRRAWPSTDSGFTFVYAWRHSLRHSREAQELSFHLWMTFWNLLQFLISSPLAECPYESNPWSVWVAAKDCFPLSGPSQKRLWEWAGLQADIQPSLNYFD